MEFGKLPDIEAVDFSLPADDPANQLLWQRLEAERSHPRSPAPATEGRLYVGCTQWGRADWVGKLYPKGTKQKEFLASYVNQFNCIELNTLFYSLQPGPVIERWASLAGEGFRFCPKLSESISHKLQLKNAGQETQAFVEALSSFGDRLGTSFLQLPESFGPDRLATLANYLQQLPAGFQLCLELRHKDWFTGTAGNALWPVLTEKGVGTVITDTAGRRDVLHMRLTAPVVFVRYISNSLHPSNLTRIEEWAHRLKEWMDGGMREIYFIVHNHDEYFAPDIALHAVERFNAICGTSLKPPRLIVEPPPPLTLF